MVLSQSVADLDELYGRDARMSMMANFAYKVILSASDSDTQRYFADLIGLEDRRKVSHTKDGGLLSIRMSETISTEERYRIQPADLAALGSELVLLYPGGYQMLHKNFYYR